jgi:hypothetical protein
MAPSALTERAKAALRRRPVYYAFSTLVLLAGVGLLSLLGAPKWLVIAFLIVAWAGLLSLLRWRKL